MDSIANAQQLLNSCYSHLMNLKKALGATNDIYIQISTAIAGNARGMLVSFFNNKQDLGIPKRDLIGYADNIIAVLHNIISKLDIRADEKERCQKDINTLNSIKNRQTAPKRADELIGPEFDRFVRIRSQGLDADGAHPYNSLAERSNSRFESHHSTEHYTPRYPNGSTGRTRTGNKKDDDKLYKKALIVSFVMILLMILAISVNQCNNRNNQQANSYIAVADSDTTAIDTTLYNEMVDTAAVDTNDYSTDEAVVQLDESSINYADARPKTGSKPYSDVYGRGRTGDNWLDFNTSGSSDYMVIVRKYGTLKVINHIYIRGGEDARIYLPNGTYTIYFYSGTDWNPDKKMGKVTGGFDTDGYTQKDGPVELYDQYGEYTLYPVQNGNLQLQSAGREIFE